MLRKSSLRRLIFCLIYSCCNVIPRKSQLREKCVIKAIWFLLENRNLFVRKLLFTFVDKKWGQP